MALPCECDKEMIKKVSLLIFLIIVLSPIQAALYYNINIKAWERPKDFSAFSEPRANPPEADKAGGE
jgi:hypothetical protein